LVTDFLAYLKASSKCFLVISGTGSPCGLTPVPYINTSAAFLLASASIHSLTAALAARYDNSERSAPENPSVNYAM